MVLWSESGITGGGAYCGLRLVQINLYRRCVMKCEIIKWIIWLKGRNIFILENGWCRT
jgi:hypothetical protein